MDLQNARRSRWCFTVNNYTTEHIEQLRKLGSTLLTSGYLIFGYENAPTTNTKHLQGYIRLNKPKLFRQLQLLLPPATHIEATKGTERQNFRYCTKSGVFEEFGIQRTQGQRTDLEQAVHELLHENGTILQVATNNPTVYVRNWRGLHELRNLLIPVKPRDFRSNIYILYGPTRTGKSRAAQKIAGDTSTYYKNRSNWWHGYHQEETVIIDDFYGWIKWDELLKLCDRYPYKVETKGGYEEFTSKTIIITSNLPPEKWYKFENFDPTPLISDRINAIVETGGTQIKIKTYYETMKTSDIEIINKSFNFINP
ncbi:Rep [Bat circovirus]|nr:Rep [Bat circovirus]